MSVTAAVRNPRAYVGRKYNRLKLLLLDPERFYEEKPWSDTLWSEIIVLLLVGLVGGAGTFYASQELMGYFVTSASDQTAGTINIPDGKALRIQAYGARGVFGILILWLYFSFGFYAISWLYSDRGSFFRTLQQTAWAMVPIVFYNFVKSAAVAIAVYLNSPLIEVNDDEMANAINDNVVMGDATEATDYLYGLVYEEPYVLGAMAVGLVFIAWTGHIAAYGIAEMRDLDVSETRRMAAVPVALYILWVVRDILTWAGVL